MNIKMLCKIFTVTAIIVNFVHSENIDYHCKHNDDFYYTTPQSHCESYYRCQSNQKIKYDCPRGMIFNFYEQKCVSDANTCYESTCQGKADGYYPDTTQSCRRFFRCSNEK
ncbi:CLUMA_CG007476, isoform A, partial [Clunio marinus]